LDLLFAAALSAITAALTPISEPAKNLIIGAK
jgi:hypothetical protein